jgi:hypothetical protein
MPVFHLIGNCQVESIEFLIEHMMPDAEIRAFDFAGKNADAAARQAFRHGLMGADYILAQPNNQSFLSHAELKRDFGGKCFVIANLYFRGLHPDACYVGATDDRFQEPSLYHSVAVLDAFKRGLPERKAGQVFGIENFERLGLFEAWESSLDEMRQRDAHSDLPGAALIESYCREFAGFLTLNHPCIGLMYLYLCAVFERMGIGFKPVNLAGLKDPLARHDVLPAHDFVAAHYGLPYRTTQHWMIEHTGRRFIDRAEYIGRCYTAYRKAEAKKLIVHSPLDLRETLRRSGAVHLV